MSRKASHRGCIILGYIKHYASVRLVLFGSVVLKIQNISTV